MTSRNTVQKTNIKKRICFMWSSNGTRIMCSNNLIFTCRPKAD